MTFNVWVIDDCPDCCETGYSESCPHCDGNALVAHHVHSDRPLPAITAGRAWWTREECEETIRTSGGMQ